MKRRRTLSAEDKALWANVMRTAKPLKGRRRQNWLEDEVEPAGSSGVLAAKGETSAKPGGNTVAAPAGKPPAVTVPVRPPALTQHPIERPTHRKLARGRLAIEARIDLHEMTQARAHDALSAFLRQAQAMGMRHVLVITGRGSGLAAAFGSRGVLRRVVPRWFEGPEFRPFVSGFESAERHHGGEGALYVRVRRRS